jgi:hypothetical protein
MGEAESAMEAGCTCRQCSWCDGAVRSVASALAARDATITSLRAERAAALTRAAMAEREREHGRRAGLREERARIIPCVEEAIGRPIADGGEYRADIRSAIGAALAALLDEARREERKRNAAIIAGWHIKRGGYTALAHEIERGEHRREEEK